MPDLKRVEEELRIHKVELEMQNEELRRTRAELENSRALYLDLYDLAPVGYFTISEKGMVLEANLTAAAMLGVAKNELIKKPLTRFILAGEHDLYYRKCKELSETRALQTWEIRMVRKNGTRFWARMEAAAQDADNKPVSRVVMSDITELKHAEESLREERNALEQLVETRTATLRESEEQYRIVIEASGEGIAIVQNDVHVYANRAFLDMFGYSDLDEIVGEQKYCIVHPDDRERIIGYAPARQRGASVPASYEFKGIRKDGTPIDVEISANETPYKGQKATIIYLRNITERKRAEKKLKERLEFEILLADLSARFVSIPPEKVDMQIDEALRAICEHLGFDIAALWQWNRGSPRFFTMTHLYRLFQGPPVPEQTDALDMFPWCVEQLTAGKIIAVSTDELPPEASRDQEMWRHYQIKSSLTFPLSTGGESIQGALSFNTVSEKRLWPEDLVNRLQLVAEIFANALARKLTEEALRESEERLSLASASVGVGLWTFDLSSGQFWATAKALELFGLESDHILDIEKFLKLVHPEDREVVIEAINQASRSNDDVRIQYRVILTNNIIRWIASRARRQLDSSGKVFQLMGVSMDITERIEMEASAAEMRSLITAVMESTDDMIWSVDPERFGLLTFNKALRENLRGTGLTITRGMSPEDMMGGGFTTAVAAQWRALYERALHEGPYTVEYNGNTSTKIFLLSFSLLKRDGKVFGISVFAKDITERKLMEEKIEASAKEWQVTFDSIPDLIMILDRERRVVRVNAAARHFLGLPPEHVVGNSCSGLVHGIKEPVEGCPFEKVMSSGKHEEIEIHDEARQLWFRVYMYPILNERGDVIQIIHRAEDITQQKKEENERFVARRALMRTERLLRMGELTASLAHELNQPLTSILSNTRAALRFIQSGKLDMGELSDILQDIAEDDKRAGSIIRSLRSMLRPQESEREIIAINDVLQEIVSVYFHSESIIRRISVETDFARSLPLVNIDKVQVQQVIINLMMNAADAMMDNVGEKRIIIRTQMSGDGGILVSIRDFGPGIDEVELAKIFEPFFTTKRSGLGMGLSLSHSIIEGQGGHIWAENNPDRGSTFYFDLPGKEKGIG